MSFNPDRNKQAQEVMFSGKIRKGFLPSPYFNDPSVERSGAHKYLELTLDEKLSFTSCINDKINKMLKVVGLLRKLSALLPRQNLFTIYKYFIRPHVDYGDVIYDQPHNESLSNRIESVQYKAVLAMTGAIQGSSREKLYQELDFEHFQRR